MKEFSHYNVIIYGYISALDKYHYLKTEHYCTEDEAIENGRKYLADKSIKYRVEIEQVFNITGWQN